MRTGHLSRTRARPRLAARPLFIALVVVPIAGSAVMAWQLSSRLFGGEDVVPNPVSSSVREEPRASPSPSVVYADPPASIARLEPQTVPVAPQPGTAPSMAAVESPPPPSPPTSPRDQAEVTNPPVDAPPAVAVAPPIMTGALNAPSAPVQPSTIPVPVDLNSASIDQLNNLGAGRIGRAIVRGRPYASREDLLRKRILSRPAYERVQRQVTVANGPSE